MAATNRRMWDVPPPIGRPGARGRRDPAAGAPAVSARVNGGASPSDHPNKIAEADVSRAGPL